jgi:hypothetical protein
VPTRSETRRMSTEAPGVEDVTTALPGPPIAFLARWGLPLVVGVLIVAKLFGMALAADSDPAASAEHRQYCAELQGRHNEATIMLRSLPDGELYSQSRQFWLDQGEATRQLLRSECGRGI